MEDISKDCFAYPQKKMYPIHTKQAALDSFKQFEKDVQNYSKDRIQLITDNFVKAAKLHDISYQEKTQPIAQVHEYDTEDGIHVKISKVASQNDVRCVVEALKTNRKDIDFNTIQNIAKKAFMQADELQINIPEMKKLACFAGFGIGDPLQMAAQFGKRAGLVAIPQKIKSEFYKTYKQMNEIANIDQSQLYKKASQLCSIMDKMDRMYKLQQYYGQQIQAPEDICFKQDLNSMIQQASDYLRINSTDTILSKQALLQSKDKVNAFLEDKYGFKAQDDQKMLDKVASLTKTGIKALIQELE